MFINFILQGDRVGISSLKRRGSFSEERQTKTGE
jgi:hypothetical protein